ncbi:MAG: proton-conducting membrane transporter [Verrucomicrobia bacterium]|nr:proton-conducting membrane transporter [Verrucomicrobiota bacterium]
MEYFTFLILTLIPGLFGLMRLSLIRYKLNCAPAFGVWLSFIGLLLFGWLALSSGDLPNYKLGIKIDIFNLFVELFILFISGIVHSFSVRYMSGDRNFNLYFVKLGLITSSLLLLIAADDLILMAAFWMFSNLLLGSLMIHKQEWSASRNSGLYMLKFFSFGGALMSLALGVLFYYAHTFSLHETLAIRHTIPPFMQCCVLFLLGTAALIQSGVWPFHKWLISSLNSPTPISGLMHAGLVNGGCLLLIRFSPLIAEFHLFLHLLFTLGLISAIVGTGWKLVQNNIKGMLACSTMAQMGFMLMQCGLGLFSAAFAHLFWHGFFKCYLFLNSGSAILENRENESKKNRLRYLLALCFALPAAFAFATAAGISLDFRTPQSVLIVFSWLASSQIAYSFFNQKPFVFKVLLGSIAPVLFGTLYGFTVYITKFALFPPGIDVAIGLNPLHMLGASLIVAISLIVNMNLFRVLSSPRLYVKMLNSSKSSSMTMTLLRNEYKF